MAGFDFGQSRRDKPGDKTIPGTWIPKSSGGALTPTITPIAGGRNYDIGSFATTRAIGEVPGATDFSGMNPPNVAPAPTSPTTSNAPPATKPPMTPKQVGRQAARTGIRSATPRQDQTGSRKLPTPEELATQIVMGREREPGSDVQPKAVGDPTTGYNWKDAISYAVNALPMEFRWGSKSPAKYAAMAQTLGHLLGAASQSFGSEVGAKSQFAGQQVASNASFANNQLDLAGKLQQDKTTAAHNKDWLGVEQGKLTEDKRQADLANALGWYTAKTGRMNAGRSGGGGGSAEDQFLTKLYADSLKDSKNPVTSMDNFRKAAGLYLGTHTPIESDTFTLGGARVKLAGAVNKKNYNEYQGLTQQLYDLTNTYNQGWFKNGKAKAELDKRRAAIFSRMKQLGVTTTPVDDDLTARADGGPMDEGKKYLVGEKGPEVAVSIDTGAGNPRDWGSFDTGASNPAYEIVGKNGPEVFRAKTDGAIIPTAPATSPTAYGGLKVAPMPVANPFGPGVLDQKPFAPISSALLSPIIPAGGAPRGSAKKGYAPTIPELLDFSVFRGSGMEEAALRGVAATNQDKNFMQRIGSQNPNASNSIPDPTNPASGRRSTHLMANADSMAFPMVELRGGRLRFLPKGQRPLESINVGSPEGAEWFSTNYKRLNPLGFGVK